LLDIVEPGDTPHEASGELSLEVVPVGSDLVELFFVFFELVSIILFELLVLGFCLVFYFTFFVY
jgi:hypothetical protein